MAVSVLVTVFKCVAIVLVVGAVPAPPKGKKTDSAGKKLRNVIITSFGEMPYEPMETSGYYQSDIIPVNLNDEIEQQTMDVALRTGILVEDPNEKKAGDEVDTIDELEETSSLEDEATSTNAKRQASDDNSSIEEKKSEKNDDEFLSPKEKLGFRKSKNYEKSKETSDKFLSRPLQYGYEFPQRRRSQIPYTPYPPPASSDSDNIDKEYSEELGEGWNLKDAEKLLKGRNYNILIVTPNHYPYSYPGPHLRETPPPIFVSSARHPLFFSLPSFEYNPGFDPHRGAASYSSNVHGDVSRRQDVRDRTSNSKDQKAPLALVTPSIYHSRVEAVPYDQARYFSEDFLTGI